MAENWIETATAAAAAMEDECSTPEGRKAFYAGDGVDRAQRQIAALDALKLRFGKFVRA